MVRPRFQILHRKGGAKLRHQKAGNGLPTIICRKSNAPRCSTLCGKNIVSQTYQLSAKDDQPKELVLCNLAFDWLILL